MRIIPIDILVHRWVTHAFECYDFHPMKPGKQAKLRTKAFRLGKELLRDGVSPEEAAQQVFFFLDNTYVWFHTSSKLMKKRPDLMSCKKNGARQMAQWVAH